MEGMLLVVTSSGKIVFISHTIESLLGHSQTDLLGQSLFNITSLEDHDELKKNLSPSEADDVSPSRPSTSSGKEIAKSKRAERRSFYLRLRHKSTPRGEQPQYETVHVMGHLRVPSPPPSSSSKKRSPSGSGPEPPQHMSHEVVLVAMMQPFKEKRITQLSLLEASREEWISRHLIDGTIVFSDHRISVVSGYMAEEVTGDFAFRYMHQDDVRWVLIALRQMYYRGESYGKSCYRLMSKTGEYIYIRTHGYLELSEDTHSVQSFVCINTLVSRDEGEQQIKEMKEMYTPMVTGHDSSVATFTAMNAPNNIPMLEMRVAGTSSDFLTPLKVDDPSELNNAIEQLLSDLPVDQIHPRDADAPVPDEQFAKCAMVSKTLMPPVHVHSSKLGVVSMPMIKKGPRYSRPSVITRAKEKRAVGEESLTAKKIKHETAESPNPMSLGIVELNRSVIKSRDDYMEMELGSNDSLVSGGSIQLARYATSPADSYTATSPTEGYVIATSPIVGTDQLTSYLCDESTDDPSSASSILVDPSTSSSIFHEFIAVDSLGPCQPSLVDSIDDPLQEPLESIGFWGRDIDSLEEGVARSHIQLNERMQFQDIQINAIEEDLSSVPVSSDGNHMIRSTFTHLKAEHRKQQQMLKTLKQDHQSLQQGGREQLSVRGAQDIGA
ncbi:PAS fold [Nesidiocoris tenuis]|uniref:PAS fold n=1 Tax=Nesidiocoris tenuis TaxID=355587 RepID=A0ABN7BBC3_9HEMI|nr:PAS fold [Nesidiocoris tenuis]